MRTILILAICVAALAVPTSAMAGSEAGFTICNASGDTCVDACVQAPELPAPPDPVGPLGEFHLCKLVVVGI